MKKLLSVLLIAMFSNLAFAGDVMTKKESDFLKSFSTKFPKVHFDDAVYLPSVNLYELREKGNSDLTYVNESMDYMYVNGELIDLKNLNNVSTVRNTLNVMRFFAELPKEKSIEVVLGNGSKKVAIFTDPECPYCQNLDKEIHSKLKDENITINYYFNPLTGIQGHEMAAMEAKKIWCAPDKKQAWVDWMVNKKMTNNTNINCKNYVEETSELAKKSGFNMTPVILFENGFVIKGGVDANTFKEVMNRKPIANGIR
jgi:thiol:disulfide interchange protein DsbC